MIDDVEREWMAEDDARTLARARSIQNDKDRLAKAKTAAGRIADRAQERMEEEQAEIAELKRISASSKPATKPGPKPGTKPDVLIKSSLSGNTRTAKPSEGNPDYRNRPIQRDKSGPL